MTQHNHSSNADALSPEAILMQMLLGPLIQKGIYVAAKLGIADLLSEKPYTTAELAAKTDTHEPSLYRVLRALASVGIFAECADGTFLLTPIATLLRSDVSNTMRDYAIFMGEEWHWRVWSEMMHSVKTGKTAVRKAYGVEAFNYLAQNPEAGELFNRAMTSSSLMEVPAIVESYDFSGAGKLVELAGGHGILLSGILKTNPQLQGVLFELPSVIEDAARLLEKEGVADRVELVSGDFFESVPAGGDTYMMKWTLHDWDDEHSVKILQNIGSAMNENGKVLIIEMVVPEGNEPSFSKIEDLEMLTGPGGKERTKDEYRMLLEASGFTLTQILPTPSPMSVIKAKRA
jgi:hypothetical protein